MSLSKATLLESHAPAAATAAVCTCVAGTATVLVHKIFGSYDTTPTGGGLVCTGLAADQIAVAIPAAGMFSLDFDPPLRCTPATNFVATLASGAGSVVGRLNVSWSPFGG